MVILILNEWNTVKIRSRRAAVWWTKLQYTTEITWEGEGVG